MSLELYCGTNKIENTSRIMTSILIALLLKGLAYPSVEIVVITKYM
jgi:hypothetical protein